MEQWEDCDAVERHPEKLGGAWVFRGTRVPLAALFENLRDGASIDQFLGACPRNAKIGILGGSKTPLRLPIR